MTTDTVFGLHIIYVFFLLLIPDIFSIIPRFSFCGSLHHKVRGSKSQYVAPRQSEQDPGKEQSGKSCSELRVPQLVASF